MIALGIDPGSRRVGYGLVEANGQDCVYITAGILTITATDDASALLETKRGIANNQKTAIAVAQARGVILLATKECGVRIREYTPNEVKAGVTGYGSADKKAVLKMVRFILKKPELRIIDDASDALALAILSTSDRLLDSA
jgi:crossover junction endodeoxyribonuclease RuvC